MSRPAWLALLALLVLVGWTYARVGTLGFVYDDHRLVELNPLLAEGADPWRFLTTGLSGTDEWKLYRPVTGISWWIDRALFGTGPAPLHVINVLWHLVAVLALVWCVSELVRADRATDPADGRDVRDARARSRPVPPVALAAGALFAVHPLNSEPVLWISRRADLMVGGFTLLALAGLVRGCRRGAPGWLGVSAGCSALALGAKEIGLVLPVLLAVAVIALRGVDRCRCVSWLLPAAVAGMVGALALVRLRLFGTVAGQPVAFVQNPLSELDLGERLLAAVGLVAHYARLVVWPRPMSADYSWRSLELGPVWSGLGIGLVLAAVLAFVWGWRRSRAVAIGVALLVITYLPISNAVVPIGAAFAERFAYLPLAGLLAAMAARVAHAASRVTLVQRAPDTESGIPGMRDARAGDRLRGAVRGGVLVVALASCAVTTHRRVDDWRTDGTLFAAALEAYPRNIVARTYVAIDARSEGRLGEAIAHYDRILELYPDYSLARVNRALIELERGNAARAASEMRWVTEREPGPGAAHYVYGLAEEQLGHLDAAERELWLAARDRRTRGDALGALARLYRRLGDEAGLRRVQQALKSGQD